MTNIPEGFTPFHGGDCPVDGRARVRLIYRGGTSHVPRGKQEEGVAAHFLWANVPSEPEIDIIGYQVIHEHGGSPSKQRLAVAEPGCPSSSNVQTRQPSVDQKLSIGLGGIAAPLVEPLTVRLRAEAALGGGSPLLSEAADEIDRLRARLESNAKAESQSQKVGRDHSAVQAKSALVNSGAT